MTDFFFTYMMVLDTEVRRNGLPVPPQIDWCSVLELNNSAESVTHSKGYIVSASKGHDLWNEMKAVCVMQ